MKKQDDYKFLTGFGGDIDHVEAIRSLSMYENIGYTPSQVEDMAFMYKEKCKEVSELRRELQDLKNKLKNRSQQNHDCNGCFGASFGDCGRCQNYGGENSGV